jgi:hypothetical protein
MVYISPLTANKPPGRWSRELQNTLAALPPGTILQQVINHPGSEKITLQLQAPDGRLVELALSGCQWFDQRCQDCSCAPDLATVAVSGSPES